MLLRENYTKEHIVALREQTGADPSILERTVFAFGLLEAIRSVGMPFIFKGGTLLLVLLDHPRRLSTDIDIIVDKDTDVDDYISKAGTIFPFLSVEEHKRKGANDIEKRHFRFHFLSPRTEKEPADCLKDTIDSCICIIGRGGIRLEDYANFKTGIRSIQGHIFVGRINGENAGTYASEVMYLAASLLTGQQEYVRIEEPDEYRDIQLKMKGIKKVNGIRNTNPTAYAYMVKSFMMLQGAGIYTDSII